MQGEAYYSQIEDIFPNNSLISRKFVKRFFHVAYSKHNIASLALLGCDFREIQGHGKQFYQAMNFLECPSTLFPQPIL